MGYDFGGELKMAASFFYNVLIFGLVFTPMWILTQSVFVAGLAMDMCILVFPKSLYLVGGIPYIILGINAFMAFEIFYKWFANYYTS